MDIAKCLHDAISKIDKAEKDSAGKLNEIVANAKNSGQGVDVRGLLSSIGNKLSPTLEQVLKNCRIETPIMQMQTTVLCAAKEMARTRKACIVMDDTELVGIFTPKDLLFRVLAKDLSPDITPISDVMTPNPDCVPPSTTLLEAMHQMHDNRYLHLPVFDPVRKQFHGIVDVMQLTYSFGEGASGKNDWQSFWVNTMDMDFDDNDNTSDVGSIHAPVTKDDSASQINVHQDGFTFKVKGEDGKVHRFLLADFKLASLEEKIRGKLVLDDATPISIHYKDSDDDMIKVCTNEELSEGVVHAKEMKWNALTLVVSVQRSAPEQVEIKALVATPTKEPPQPRDMSNETATMVDASQESFSWKIALAAGIGVAAVAIGVAISMSKKNDGR